ncbi:DNA inteRNAlization/competence protein comec/rec2 [Anaeramoeba flamelloides]|uniref:DNA inteRNAlization/competence protein comec/rec2 n=1 Tax=Anaeramoeba flamelloides TaxID=1746091 RepID=A0ABQ8YZI5_9EUKA|nr:DNA inteRNAlization/competence protein comec/rec2 [Anaeramoeba flamelloides]
MTTKEANNKKIITPNDIWTLVQNIPIIKEFSGRGSFVNKIIEGEDKEVFYLWIDKKVLEKIKEKELQSEIIKACSQSNIEATFLKSSTDNTSLEMYFEMKYYCSIFEAFCSPDPEGKIKDKIILKTTVFDEKKIEMETEKEQEEQTQIQNQKNCHQKEEKIRSLIDETVGLIKDLKNTIIPFSTQELKECYKINYWTLDHLKSIFQKYQYISHLMLYLNGHSDEDGKFYFKINEYKKEFFDFDQFLQFLQDNTNSKDMTYIIIIDSCFSGKWVMDLYNNQKKFKDYSILIQASCSPYQTSYSGKFTELLKEAFDKQNVNYDHLGHTPIYFCNEKAQKDLLPFNPIGLSAEEFIQTKTKYDELENSYYENNLKYCLKKTKETLSELKDLEKIEKELEKIEKELDEHYKKIYNGYNHFLISKDIVDNKLQDRKPKINNQVFVESIDVKNGDCIAIYWKKKKILIDLGSSLDSSNIKQIGSFFEGKEYVENFNNWFKNPEDKKLKSLVINLLIITHPHKDHFGGLENVDIAIRKKKKKTKDFFSFKKIFYYGTNEILEDLKSSNDGINFGLEFNNCQKITKNEKIIDKIIKTESKKITKEELEDKYRFLHCYSNIKNNLNELINYHEKDCKKNNKEENFIFELRECDINEMSIISHFQESETSKNLLFSGDLSINKYTCKIIWKTIKDIEFDLIKFPHHGSMKIYDCSQELKSDIWLLTTYKKAEKQPPTVDDMRKRYNYWLINEERQNKTIYISGSKISYQDNNLTLEKLETDFLEWKNYNKALFDVRFITPKNPKFLDIEIKKLLIKN